MSIMTSTYAQRTFDFLNSIGIQTTVSKGAKGFIEGVEIHEGTLRVDPDAKASNMLHEAGHLAVVPTRFRHYLSGNLHPGFKRIEQEMIQEGLDIEDPQMVAMMQAGDAEATAWAWAAGKAIDLPEDEIIRSEEYDGEGDDIRLMLSLNAYMGIHGISRSGFCSVRANPYRNIPAYPGMAFWLQS